MNDLTLCRAERVNIYQDSTLVPLPVNTDGGLIANGEPIGASGLRQVNELVVPSRNCFTRPMPRDCRRRFRGDVLIFIRGHWGVNRSVAEQLKQSRLPSKVDRQRMLLGHIANALPSNPLAPRRAVRVRHPEAAS